MNDAIYSNFEAAGAVIVVYHPNVQDVARLLECLAHLSCVIVVKNDEAQINSKFWHQQSRLYANLIVRQMSFNVGIGAAINLGANLLMQRNVHYMWTFDQDSLPDFNALPAMLKQFEKGKLHGEMLAALVPLIRDQVSGLLLPFLIAGPDSELYTMDACTATNVECAITSGMLIDLQHWQSIGGMNEQMFIDHVDTEWCFRARHLGYSIQVCQQAVLLHHLGAVNVWQIGSWQLVRRMRSPARTFFMIRNGRFLSTLAHVPAKWRRYQRKQTIKILISAILWGPERWVQLRAVLQALRPWTEEGRTAWHSMLQ